MRVLTDVTTDILALPKASAQGGRGTWPPSKSIDRFWYTCRHIGHGAFTFTVMPTH